MLGQAFDDDEVLVALVELQLRGGAERGIGDVDDRHRGVAERACAALVLVRETLEDVGVGDLRLSRVLRRQHRVEVGGDDAGRVLVECVAQVELLIQPPLVEITLPVAVDRADVEVLPIHGRVFEVAVQVDRFDFLVEFEPLVFDRPDTREQVGGHDRLHAAVQVEGRGVVLLAVQLQRIAQVGRIGILAGDGVGVQRMGVECLQQVAVLHQVLDHRGRFQPGRLAFGATGWRRPLQQELRALQVALQADRDPAREAPGSRHRDRRAHGVLRVAHRRLQGLAIERGLGMLRGGGEVGTIAWQLGALECQPLVSDTDESGEPGQRGGD